MQTRQKKISHSVVFAVFNPRSALWYMSSSIPWHPILEWSWVIKNLYVVSILQAVQSHKHRALYEITNFGFAYNALQDTVCVCNPRFCRAFWDLVQITQKDKWGGGKNMVPQDFHNTQIITPPALTQEIELHLTLISCQNRLFLFVNFIVSEEFI